MSIDKNSLETIRKNKITEAAQIYTKKIEDAVPYMLTIIKKFDDKIENLEFSISNKERYIEQPNKYYIFKQKSTVETYNEISLKIEVDNNEFKIGTIDIKLEDIENFINSHYDKNYLAKSKVTLIMDAVDDVINRQIKLKLIPKN